jgi:hypothetical protein
LLACLGGAISLIEQRREFVQRRKMMPLQRTLRPFRELDRLAQCLLGLFVFIEPLENDLAAFAEISRVLHDHTDFGRHWQVKPLVETLTLSESIVQAVHPDATAVSLERASSFGRIWRRARRGGSSPPTNHNTTGGKAQHCDSRSY